LVPRLNLVGDHQFEVLSAVYLDLGVTASSLEFVNTLVSVSKRGKIDDSPLGILIVAQSYLTMGGVVAIVIIHP